MKAEDENRVVPTSTGAALEQTKLSIALAAALLVSYVGTLALAFRFRFWILDAKGQPTAQDFGAFWSAGTLALRHMAVVAYDPAFQHVSGLVREAHGFSHVLEWSYPPVFFFVAMILASMPYALAFASWVVVTLCVHVRIIAVIADRPSAMILAAAAPWTMLCAISGQNGFFTAAIVGAVLVNLEKRAVVAGIILGLLSYKPQLGLLFPVALAFGGYRRAFLWACVSTVVLLALSIVVFGPESFAVFLSRLPATTESHLLTNTVGWSKLQSLYGALRWLHFANGVAWAAQVALSIACAGAVAILWRSGLSFDLKAAGLSAALLFVTPYIFIYDLPVLSVAIAFMFRQRSFDRTEFALLWLFLPAFALFAWHSWPIGLFATMAVGALVLRRCLETRTAALCSRAPTLATIAA
jgi:hypothetical protein